MLAQTRNKVTQRWPPFHALRTFHFEISIGTGENETQPVTMKAQQIEICFGRLEQRRPNHCLCEKTPD